MSIKDCFGNAAEIGDEICFSVGNSGAKTWETATITKISEKCVYFKGKPGSNWRQGEITELRRSERCFVINIFKREPGLIGQSNAWKRLSKHIHEVDGKAKEIRDEVSEQLHRDGCASAAIHHMYFIDALIERVEDENDN